MKAKKVWVWNSERLLGAGDKGDKALKKGDIVPQGLLTERRIASFLKKGMITTKLAEVRGNDAEAK